jgi:hypothetical protein
MQPKNYPKSAEDWRLAIESGLNLSRKQAKNAYLAGTFPYDQFETWINNRFSQGYHPDFIPALRRNIQGLVSWAYGDGSEPFWPGSDNQSRTS